MPRIAESGLFPIGIAEVQAEIGKRRLGHPGQDTTAHDEIADGEFRREAALATDEIMREIDQHSTRDLWPKPTG